MKIEYLPSRPGKPSPTIPSLAKAIRSFNPRRLRAGFAFATHGGVTALFDGVSNEPQWLAIEKKFLIGISQCITEPNALRMLANLQNSEVRMYIPGGRLQRSALFSPPVFHPKLVCLETASRPRRIFLLSSSANLTASAIGAMPRNYEFGVSVSTDSSDLTFDKRFSPWWRSVWNEAKPVTKARLERYASIRHEAIQKNPDFLHIVDPPATVSDAKQLWIEVGKGSGIQRHQVEFNETLASFFGPVLRGKVILTLHSKGQIWNDRPLTHKKTTYKVDIWRLGMPTLKKGGVPIKDRVIRFSKTDSPREFSIEVQDLGSASVRKWERTANLHGHIGQTRGTHARRYGVI